MRPVCWLFVTGQSELYFSALLDVSRCGDDCSRSTYPGLPSAGAYMRSLWEGGGRERGTLLKPKTQTRATHMGGWRKRMDKDETFMIQTVVILRHQSHVVQMMRTKAWERQRQLQVHVLRYSSNCWRNWPHRRVPIITTGLDLVKTWFNPGLDLV